MRNNYTRNGAAFIARREGFVSVAYPDGRYFSIGFGYNSPDVSEGQSITFQRGLELLDIVVHDVARRVDQKLSLQIHPHRFDALVSAAYNLGVTGINGVIDLVNQRKFEAAMDELEKYCRIKTGNNFEISEGLKRRRARERDMFLNANYGDIDMIPTWNGDPHVVPMEWTPFLEV